MPSASFRHATTVPVDVSTAWNRMQEGSFWALLGLEGVSGETRHPDGTLAGFTFEISVAGRTYAGTARTVEAHRDERMVVLVESRPMTGRLEVVLAPAGTGTSVDVTVGLSARGVAATLAFPAVTAVVGGRFAETVDRLAARLAD